MPRDTTGPYGPNSAAVARFIDRVRRLTQPEGDSVRHAYVTAEQPPDAAGAVRAVVTLAVIETAVRASLKNQHRKAIEDCRKVLAASEAKGTGMGVHLGDLAGAIVVREILGSNEFDFLAGGWREALGEQGL